MSSQGSEDAFFGWDLLYKTIERDLERKSDVLIVVVHFLLIKQSKFHCLGIGEDKTIGDNETGSELLPNGWNDNGDKYALRYASNNELYLLLGHVSGDSLIINLLDVKSKKVSNIALEPEVCVKQLKGSIKDVLINSTELVDSLRKELLEPVCSGTAKEIATQTTEDSSKSRVRRDEDYDPLRIGEPRRPLGGYSPLGNPFPSGFPQVGAGDLDPFGRLGSGNLLGFPQRPRFQGQPRFDPFDPDGRNIGPNPNPDHFQPPNFGGGNYYM